ncbi:MAG: 50S ribosomal protein L35 [Patescibacteria group bacterium]
MPKMKTHQAIAKRFKVKKSGKILKRTDGQDHFNSRETGKVKRNKRSDKDLKKMYKKTIRQAMPYKS